MLFALVSCVLTLAAVSARAGVIEGTVKDKKSGDALIGANVKVVGTNLGAATDIDGHYVIENVPDGVYSLRVFYGGFTPEVISGIAVAGDKPVKADVKLEPIAGDDAMRIEDIYVTAERVRNTNAAILTERARSAAISDGISAEQIRLSPDGTSSDALKRVTGLSIVDNKFVFIRGVTDRYNSTTLNGVGVTSTDANVDKKSFSFDLIPASLISNTIVAKTATPDLPGDFSGGLVQVNTLDFPTGLMANVSAESGYDEISSRKDIRVGPEGGDDWKGEDDGTRARPPDVEGVALAKTLPNNWATSPDRSRNNGSYAVTLGNSFGLGGFGEIGVVASGTYKNNYRVSEFYQEPEVSDQRLFMYRGDRFNRRVLMGGLANVSYRPNRNHKVTFENDYTRTADNRVMESMGLPENGDTARVQAITWNQRDLYLGQLSGDHALPALKDIKVDWRYAFSNSDASEPDRKYAVYQRDALGRYTIRENYRTWSALTEDSHTGLANLEVPLGKAKLKTGLLTYKREREFESEAWVTDPSTLRGANRALVIEPIETIFDADHYGPDLFDFKLASAFTGDYTGVHDLNAYYGMADGAFRVLGQNFRAAGGVRVEDSRQQVDSPVSAQEPDNIQTAIIDERDILPSANLSWQTTRTTALRLGYFASVNRPEFREMANVGYRDYERNQNVIGNPNLARATIRNYDVRVEWFPKLGEVLAASWFYKDFNNAIEEQLLPSPDKYVRTWFNSPTGKNYGYELEARKGLGFVWGGLEHLVVQTNYTKVTSEVEYTDTYTDEQGNAIYETRQRTMQGQAPYTFNAGVTYTVPDIGLSMSLLFNRFGRRLEAVGDTRDYDVYEESRDLYDFAVTEEFTPWMRLKFSIKDIAADDIVYTFGDTGSIWESVKVGTTYALSLSFNL
jgi:TonB-dependent receptor